MGRLHWLTVYLNCYVSSVVLINKQCFEGYCFIEPNSSSYYDVQKTITDAQHWCRNNSAVLLEITDEHLQAAFQSYLNHGSLKLNPFLNAQFQQTQWTWADGTKYYSSWDAIQGNDLTDARYAYLKFDANNLTGIFVALVLETTARAFICQYPGDQCPSWISLTDGLCIEVNSSSKSWFGARLSCFQSGGDLASLHDIQSSSLINKLQLGTEYWIGLTNGQWIWLDSGTPMVYNNWQPGRPRFATCLCMNYGDGSWTDCECGTDTRPFICSANASTMSTTSKSSPSQTTSTSKSSDQISSIGVAVGVSIGIIVLILIILSILLIIFRKRCQIGSLFSKLRERAKSKEVQIYQDAADCQSPAQVLPPDTAFSNITYSSPKVGPYEEIHSPDNIYSEPEHDDGNKYSEVSFNSTDVEAGIPTKVEYMELCDDAGVDETAPHEGVTSGNDVVRDSPYDNFVKEPVNSSSPSIELSSPLRNSGNNDDTILLDNELYS